MDEQELNQVIQDIKTESSGVEIRLFDALNNRVLYKSLSNSELEKVLGSLKEIKWNNLNQKK